MKRRGSRSKGQGLVEYALILVLVVVVVIVIAIRFGHSIQGIFGLVTASLGTKVNSSQIEIDYAECFVHQSTHSTGIWVRGVTTVPLDTLSARTERNYGGTIDVNDVGPGPTGAGSFKYTTILTHQADSSACPRAVVVQSDNGGLAAWPLKLSVDNN